MCAKSPGPTMPRSIGRVGAGACTIVSQLAQASLGRTWRIILKLTDSSSSMSLESSPRCLSLPPQSGQLDSRGIIVCVSRGRCSGNSRRGFGAPAVRPEPDYGVSSEERRAEAASSCSTHNSNCSISFARFSLRLPNCMRRNFRICSLSASIRAAKSRISASLATSSSFFMRSCACCSWSSAFSSATLSPSRLASSTLAESIL